MDGWMERDRVAFFSVLPTRGILTRGKKKRLCLLDWQSCGPGFNLHVSDYGADTRFYKSLMLPSRLLFPVDFVINLLGSVRSSRLKWCTSVTE